MPNYWWTHGVSNVTVDIASKRTQHCAVFCSQIFVNKSTFLEITTGIVSQWLKHHSLEVVDISLWVQFVEQQWPHHLRASKDCITWHDLKRIQGLTKEFVIHCVDQRPYEVWIFCPVLYYQLLMNSFFGSQEVRSIVCTYAGFAFARHMQPDDFCAVEENLPVPKTRRPTG